MSKLFYDQEDTAIKIRKLRNMKGYKQEEFGILLGYADRFKVYRMESGKYEHSLYDLQRVADIFGVSLVDLIGKKEDNRNDSTEKD